MRPNQVMFIYKPQLKDVKSRKETTLQISARNTNSRKIAANTVFSVLGNSDVQRGLLKIRVMACGSECRRFESVRAPQDTPYKSKTYGDFLVIWVNPISTNNIIISVKSIDHLAFLLKESGDSLILFQ